MIIVNSKTEETLKDPAMLTSVSEPDLKLVKLHAMEGNLLFLIPNHIKTNKEKRIYKIGFLNELYTNLFPKKEYKEYTKTNIFKQITNNYQVFIELRQYQDDVRVWKKEKYTKFIQKCI